MLECQSNFTLRECKCIPYYLPKNKFVKNCDKVDDNCVKRIKVEVEDLKNGSFLTGECNCKPGCFQYQFGHITSQSTLMADAFVNIENVKRIKKSYTQRNCNLECQSNHTLKHCSCVPYYLPKNKFIKYCGKTEKECVDQAKEDMEVVYGNGSSCHCLPGCFFLRFSNSKSFAKLSDMGLRAEVGSYSKEYFMDNVAVVQFFFFKSQFTKEVKSELFGFTEILSNVGGLLSLCLGFSFLSLIELLYFVTLRLACELAKKRRTNQKRLHHKGSPIYPFMK